MSEEGDKGWFHDREMWGEYLSMLVTQRFNRFSMTLGMQYNYPYHNAWITDVYMYFPYPFLIDVPDYNICVEGLSTQEREKNLRTLQFISTEAARRGLEFQLAIWTHGYDFDDTPNASHHVRGITRENHAAYCRDALHKLLSACPAITGLTLRVHVESGIAEGDYEFWRTVFEGIVAAGRRIEIDLHAKGVDPQIIEIALATGMPVNISPKYMGEHMGPPYHQASIRDWEMPPDEAVGSMFTFSEGSRRFLRYSYGDLLKEDRPYGVFFRIWAGTQRVLLWGDPAMAAGYGRSSTFAGSLGVELCEPLFFEGRGGRARVGSRFNYADATLRPRYDWEKYLYNYRIWGRLNYNPQTSADGWRRHLNATCGAAASELELALANASRILPLVTLGHAPSASNNNYWPELPANMSIVHASSGRPNGHDIAQPARFGTASAFDPQLFLSCAELVELLVEDRYVTKYTPLDVAQWLLRFAEQARTHLLAARTADPLAGAEPRRIAIDVAIMAGLGDYFAWKLRSACFWELYLRTAEMRAAEQAIDAYRRALSGWKAAAATAQDPYLPDLMYGPQNYLRGRWDDRVPAIEQDIAAMESAVAAAPAGSDAGQSVSARLLAWPQLERPRWTHRPAPHFRHGEPIHLTLTIEGVQRPDVHLHYRHVNQAEPWRSTLMTLIDETYNSMIPSAYTESSYPLQYYFDIRHSNRTFLIPGLEQDISNEPYFTLRRREAVRN